MWQSGSRQTHMTKNSILINPAKKKLPAQYFLIGESLVFPFTKKNLPVDASLPLCPTPIPSPRQSSCRTFCLIGGLGYLVPEASLPAGCTNDSLVLSNWTFEWAQGDSRHHSNWNLIGKWGRIGGAADDHPPSRVTLPSR
jgi:hypothetical protein